MTPAPKIDAGIESSLYFLGGCSPGEVLFVRCSKGSLEPAQFIEECVSRRDSATCWPAYYGIQLGIGKHHYYFIQTFADRHVIAYQPYDGTASVLIVFPNYPNMLRIDVDALAGGTLLGN
jgi:hypothetical protein